MTEPLRYAKARLIFWMARYFRHFAGGLNAEQSLQWARDTLDEYERELGVEFGHPDYDWSPRAANIIVQEMALQYWEQPA